MPEDQDVSAHFFRRSVQQFRNVAAILQVVPLDKGNISDK